MKFERRSRKPYKGKERRRPKGKQFFNPSNNTINFKAVQQKFPLDHINRPTYSIEFIGLKL